MFSKFALLTLATSTVAYVTPEQERKAFDAIRSSIPSLSSIERYPTCTISPTESCDITKFENDKTALVYPGGETRCIFSDSTPYSFQVIPGDKDKVIFYFQAGGACWTQYTTSPLSLCSTDAQPYGYDGIFDRTNEDNLHRTHTVVVALYCSGDVFGGNVTRPYNDRKGVPVQQKGYLNAEATLRWVEDQQAKGLLAAELEDLIVMGASAGSIGAQLWADQVLTRLPAKRASVVSDSFVALFPEGTQGPLIQDYGLCGAPMLSPALEASCEKGELTLQEILGEWIPRHASVPFTFIQSKVDEVQYMYYMAVAATARVKVLISPDQFYREAADILIKYSQAFANVLTYLVNGDRHTFTYSSVYYTADPMGKNDAGKTSDSIWMKDWVNAQPLQTTQVSLASVCDGELVKQSEIKDHQRDTYCPQELDGKTYTQI